MNAVKIIAHITLVLAIFAPAQAYAQNVKMRTGAHDEYSRLVVDWPEKALGTLKQNAQTLTISFDKAADPTDENVNTAKARNINSIEVTNKDPLTISVKMPGDNRYRSFYAGDRYVLDIYNLEGSQPLKTAAKPEPEPEPEPEPKPKSKPGEKPQPVSDTKTQPAAESVKEPTAEKKPTPKPLKEVVKQAKSATVEPVEVQTLTTEDNTPQPDFATLENPGLNRANLIALSSSKTFGLAVFERGDQIYIINDDPDLLISPKITGPDAKDLAPVMTTDLDNAKIFKAQNLLGSYLRTQGGGLLWKVIIAGTKTKEKPVEPKRIGTLEGKLHSGKLFFAFQEPSKLIEIEDPITGGMIKIVTSKTSKDFTGEHRSFPEFDILASAAGIAILPRVDDLQVTIKEAGVEISRPNGLAVLTQDRIERNESVKQASANTDSKNTKRIFDFKNWQLGGLDALRENQNILLSNAAQLPASERDSALMTLAKMFLSNGMGAESLGFLQMIENYTPEIANTAEFRAIRGAAKTLDYKTEDAFNDMAIKELDEFEEIGFWKAVALADIGDWQQAIDVMPKSASLLYEYPERILNRIGPTAAEVALRAGNTDLANDILSIIEEKYDTLNEQQVAAVNYLKGEKFRQLKEIENTKQYWQPLVVGKDDLYRAKAGLALARLQIDEGEIKPEDAVNMLERLRYSWRGDQLEAQIGYWLGRTYFEAGEFLKGLNLMREAATVAAGTSLGARITNEMTDLFTQLYLSDTLDKVSPLDAVALYEQFSEIVPGGETGDKIVERLADRLTAADLLGRAGDLLSYQLTHRLNGLEAYNVAVKLAAIQLLDNNASEALKTIDIAQNKFNILPENQQTPDKIQEMTLLRARALSRNGRPDQGIKMLEDLNSNPATNRLRADIAWIAGYWDDAASALGDVIIDQNISLTRPLNESHTSLILQRAISLNLATDRIGLANMREKYSDAMKQTDKARIFEVITRPRQSAALADRETLMGIVSEVDLFSDFLESYKTVGTPSN